MRRAAALALILSLACSRRATDAVASGDAAPTAPSASALASAAPLDDASRKVLTAWNDALDRHDLPALERIYAPAVSFYGQHLSRATVLEIKKRALGPKSTFHQSIIGEPTITRRADGADTILLVKRSGNDGKMRDTKAVLTVRDGLVIEELDAQTKVSVHGSVSAPVDESSPSAACEAAAAKAVSALPAVQQMTRKNQKAVAAHPGTTVGGLGPISEPGGGFSASVGIQHADRYEASLWYTVDAEGHLSVMLYAEALAVPAASLEAVERACKLP